MTSFCGADCTNCGYGKNCGCKGCTETDGCPFGKKCFIADYIKTGGREQYDRFVKVLLAEINSLDVPGLPEIKELFALSGAYVNLEYPLPGGGSARFLDNRAIYLGTQVECVFGEGEAERCYGIVADPSFILVAEYGENGSDPELVIYKKR